MAHQCLQCGRSYPDGSPQILKGCECKGTRFFYTQKPLGEEERERLAQRTDSELSGEPDGSPQQDRPERRIPTKGELPVGQESDPDWVSMGPGNLRSIVEDVVRRAQDKKPTFRVGASGSDKPRPSLEEWVREQQESTEESPATESHDQEEGPSQWPPWPEPRRHAQEARRAAPRPGPEKLREIPDVEPEKERRVEPASESEPQAGDPVIYRRKTPPAPLDLQPEPEETSGGDSAVEKEDPAREGQPLPEGLEPTGEEVDASADHQKPETVEILEQGVYDLDVERLLGKSPIVVHKDGRYSLHLPSLMESLEKKRR